MEAITFQMQETACVKAGGKESVEHSGKKEVRCRSAKPKETAWLIGARSSRVLWAAESSLDLSQKSEKRSERSSEFILDVVGRRCQSLKL